MVQHGAEHKLLAQHLVYFPTSKKGEAVKRGQVPAYWAVGREAVTIHQKIVSGK